MKPTSHPLKARISDSQSSLTPKGRMLADYILKNSRKVVFMTTKELAKTSGVSEATVIRFVARLKYSGYTAFLQDLRDLVDTELKLVDRLDLPDRKSQNAELLQNVVLEEIVNLQHLYTRLDLETAGRAVDLLKNSSTVFVTGSRLSYALAYYFGWSLIKIRPNVHILQGSDSTVIDYLTIAPPDSLVVIIATTRYPNDLIRAGKYARRLGHSLLLITDGNYCPLLQFATVRLVIPLQSFSYIGIPSMLSCLINYLIHDLATKSEKTIKMQQEKLEKAYLENDLMFNIGANS